MSSVFIWQPTKSLDYNDRLSGMYLSNYLPQGKYIYLC